MAIKNQSAAKLGRHGGARRGAGRPLGSPEKGQRKRKGMTALDRVKAIQQQLGEALKERDDARRQVEDLRFQLNYGKAYPGDSKALMTATYKGEYFPSQEQLYAGKLMLEREYPAAERGEYETDATGKVVCYLPHNGRDPLVQREEDADEAADFWVRELQKRKRASIMDWDMWLHQQIAAGETSEDFALKVRGRVIKPRAPADQQSDDMDVSVPEWEPVKPGHVPDTAPWLISKIEAQPPQNGHMATDNKSEAPQKLQPNGEQKPAADVRRVQVLYGVPGLDYREHGLNYVGDYKTGEILADEKDVWRLVNRFGCRLRR